MTGHKTVAMFLRYVHPDEKRVRKSVEMVGAQRRKLVNSSKLTMPKQDVVPDVSDMLSGAVQSGSPLLSEHRFAMVRGNATVCGLPRKAPAWFPSPKVSRPTFVG
jgi:hypothetical protein